MFTTKDLRHDMDLQLRDLYNKCFVAFTVNNVVSKLGQNEQAEFGRFEVII